MVFLLTLGKISAVLALVLLNGFFVAAEFAIVKVRSTQIEPLVKRGLKSARTAQHVISHLDTYLSASQLGITMTSLGLGWIGEPAVADLLEPLFTLVGISQPAVVAAISFALAFATITYLHIVVGEQAPKWLAIQRAEQTTLIVAPPLHFFFVSSRIRVRSSPVFPLRTLTIAIEPRYNRSHQDSKDTVKDDLFDHHRLWHWLDCVINHISRYYR
jgi:CBS domain containing-hemolysin-like protein